MMGWRGELFLVAGELVEIGGAGCVPVVCVSFYRTLFSRGFYDSAVLHTFFTPPSYLIPFC